MSWRRMAVTLGLKIVTSELGMSGMASGLQMQVTKMEMWRSSVDEVAAVLEIASSWGANHSMQPGDSAYSEYSELLRRDAHRMTVCTTQIQSGVSVRRSSSLA